MRIDPKVLAEHLSHIHLPGEIDEITLRDRFSGVGKNEKGDLLAWLPPLEGFGPLPEPIGINLRVTIGSLRLLADWDCAEVDANLSEGRLVLTGDPESSGAKFSLLVLEPTLTKTYISPTDAEELAEDFSFGEAFPLNRLTWDEWYGTARHQEGEVPKGGITKAVPSFVPAIKADRAILSVSSDGGQIQLTGKVEGAPDYVEDQALVEMPHGLMAPEPYELEFRARLLAKVFGWARKFPGCRIQLSGPGSPILFQEDPAYQLLLFPKGFLRSSSQTENE